jgi:hypothetical protein
MNKYLFVILNRYQPKLSRTISFESGMTPKKAFKSAVLKYGVMGWVEEYGFDPNEWYRDTVARDVCKKGNLVTHDDREQSLVLIKLEN